MAVAIEEREIIQEFGIPIGKIFELPIFSESRIRAGRAGLERLVNGVNIMEVPDIGKWVKPGQLLVTACYAIKDNPKAQQELIPSLVEKGLAGICIKTKRYLQEIPPVMLLQAEQFGFPVIELSSGVSFADVIHQVLSEILHEQSNYLLHMLNIHSALMKIMIEGGGLKKIADTLSDLVENPVCIIDLINDRRIYSYNTKEESILKLQAALHDKRNSTGGGCSRTKVHVNGKKYGCYHMPIMVASECYGHIWIWETNREVTGNDIHAVERLSIVTAMEIAREQSLRAVERKYFDEYLHHLLSGRIEDEGIEPEHALKFGLDLEMKQIVAMISLTPPQDDDIGRQTMQEARNQVGFALPKKMLEKGIHCLVGNRGDNLVLLLDLGDQETGSQKLNNLAKEQLDQVAKYIKQCYPNWKVMIGLGRFHPGIKGLRQSYKEAKRALRICEHLSQDEDVVSFNDLGLYRFIYAQDRDQEIHDYIRETLGKLLTYDQEKNTELIHTLKVYFQHHGNLKRVSEAMFTHYNTILYRLERIREITGYDLNCAEERFNLELALKLLDGIG